MEEKFWQKDITGHIIGTLAVFGLVVSASVATICVASLGVQAQVALGEGGASQAAAAAATAVAIPVKSYAVSSSSTGNSSTTLKSAFLGNDPDAQQIARGEKTVTLPNGQYDGNQIRDFRWKLVNAYRMLGYQADGMPYGKVIDAAAIKDIDSQVAAMETIIAAKAAEFPFYASSSRNTFVNNLPSNYGAYVMASIWDLVNVGPIKYQSYTPACMWASLYPTNSGNLLGGGVKAEGSARVPGSAQLPFTIQQGILYGFSSRPAGTGISPTETSEVPVASTLTYVDGFVHELTHDMDSSLANSYVDDAYPRATSCTGVSMDFKEYDTLTAAGNSPVFTFTPSTSPFASSKHPVNDCQITSSGIPDPSHPDPVTSGPNCANYVTGYASANIFEDTAESVDAYIVAPDFFRARAKGSALLQQKYDYIKSSIFGGVEFDNPALASTSLQFDPNGSLTDSLIAAHVQKFVVSDIKPRVNVTVPTSTPTLSPLVTYMGSTGNTVSGAYANLPANAQIVIVNQTSGQVVPGIGVVANSSGAGTLSLSAIPSGAFYLRAQTATGAYLAQSVVFYSTASTLAVSADTQRKQDLQTLSDALKAYYAKHATYNVAGAGAGAGGQGVVTADGLPTYQTIVQGLIADGDLLANSIVPSVVAGGYYLLYTCNAGQSFALSAKLTNPSSADISNIQSSCNGTGDNGTYTLYARNYAVTGIPVITNDAKRKQDLQTLASALNGYYAKHTTYVVSGAGASGDGQGVVSQDGAPQYKTIAQGLIADGDLSASTTLYAISSDYYLLYTCNAGQSFALSAKLDNPSSTDITNIQASCNGTGANGTYTLYKRNYSITGTAGH